VPKTRASAPKLRLIRVGGRLTTIQRATLEMLAMRDDEWLERSVPVAPKINAHWVWFHVAEDEINHRGQIRWLRARLPKP